MSKEEAIDWLTRVKSNTVNHTLEMPLWWNEPLAEAIGMAIKALEQEPCDDAISKQAVLNTLSSYRAIIEDKNHCLYIGYIYDVPRELLGKIIDEISIIQLPDDIALHILVE